MVVTSSSVSPPSEADIARRAYEIYEREGRPDGRDFAHWIQAETELAAR